MGRVSEQTPSTPPGWYPTPDGQQRYWDGTQWTDHVAPAAPVGQPQPMAGPVPGAPMGGTDDRTWAVLAHAGAILFGFLAPLIIYLVKKDESPFIRHHAAEALNFSITVFIAFVVSFILIFVLIGLLLLPVVGIGSLILAIMAAIAANRGEWYRYPINIRMIS